MGGLTGFIKGLYIDDYLSLIELENMLVNRDIRQGVFRYSTNFRNSNIMSNYETGGQFRNGMGYTYGYYYDKENESLEKPSIKTNDIGAAANIDFYKNIKKLKFLSTNDYLEINIRIR